MTALRPAAAKVHVIRARRGRAGLDLATLWSYRELIYFFVWRDIKVRYRQTVLGGLGDPAAVRDDGHLHPSSSADWRRVSSDGLPYPIFAFTALLPWTFFADGASARPPRAWSANRIADQKIYFPADPPPVGCRRRRAGRLRSSPSLVLSRHAASCYGIVPDVRGVLVVPLCSCVALLTRWACALCCPRSTCGTATCATSSLSLVQIWLFLTPVAYPSSLIIEPWRTSTRSTRWSAWSRAFAGRSSAPRPRPGPCSPCSTVVALLISVGWRCLLPRRSRAPSRTWSEPERLAIQAEGLGKRYPLGPGAGTHAARQPARARSDGARRRLRDGRRRETVADTFWALRDVSLRGRARRGRRPDRPQRRRQEHAAQDPRRGSPSRPTGEADVHGRVGSLLEVGTGFHPELTGRENIYLNGAILGMRRAEIDRQFDEIVAFAEVGAVPRHPGQALLDRHVRAAGLRRRRPPRARDPARRRGAGGRRRRVPAQVPGEDERGRRAQGRTVLFVSHNMGAIQRLCDRSLLLEGGRLVDAGPTRQIVAKYLHNESVSSGPQNWIDVSAAARRGTGQVQFLGARYTSGNELTGFRPYPDGPLEFELKLLADEPSVIPSFGVVLSDRNGTKLVNADILTWGLDLRVAAGETAVRLTIDRLHLHAGVYSVALWAGEIARGRF